jgi:hypothetical protein
VFRPATTAVKRGLGNLGYDLGQAAPAALTPAEAMATSAARKIGPDNLFGQLEEASRLGVPMAPVDTGAALRSLGGAAVRRSPAAAQVAENALLPRARGQIDRLGQAVETNLGPVGNVPQASADLMTQARTAAGPLYDAAYAAPGAGAVHPEIADMLQRPSMQKALNGANRIAAEEGRDPTTLGFDLDAQGNTTLSSVPSWQTLDYVKRGLDDVVESARDPLTKRLNTEGNAINSTRANFLKTVDQFNPDYAKARVAYAGPAQAAGDLQAGYDAFSANPNQLGVDLGNAGPATLSQMQLGYRGALMDKANSVRTSTNPFDATLGTPAAEQRLGMMFRGSAGVSPLLRTRDLENTLARTNNKILGNSDTAERQLADQAFGAGALPAAALDAGMMAVGGVPTASIGRALAGGGLRDAMTLGLGKRAVAKADALAPILFNTDPADSLGVMKNLLSADDAYRNYINRLPSRRGLGMFGAGVGGAGAASLLSPGP